MVAFPPTLGCRISQVPPSSGLEQVSPGPEEGLRVVTPRGKPRGCIRFSLSLIPEGVVGIGGWGHWRWTVLLGIHETRPAQSTQVLNGPGAGMLRE